MGGKSQKITKKQLQSLLNATSKHFNSPNPSKPTAIYTSNNSATTMEGGGSSSSSESKREPLSDVVSDCVKRWFKDTLKEAKAGDISMQVLVSQMYYSGYGVSPDAHKGRLWMTRASRTRSSVWRVSNKRPGYNASDSDSDE